MKKYLIEDLKFGISDGGVTCCGPQEGSVNVSIKYNDGEVSKWILNSEFCGFANMFLSDEDISPIFINQDFDADVDPYRCDELEGIDFSDGEYETIVNSLDNCKDKNLVSLIKLLLVLTVCTMEEYEDLSKNVVGHYSDEFEFDLADYFDFLEDDCFDIDE